MFPDLLLYQYGRVGSKIWAGLHFLCLLLTRLCVVSSGKLRPQETDRRTTEAT